VDLYDGKGVQKVGTSDRVACGTTFRQIGWAGQEPGYLAAALVVNGILPKSEMEKLSADAKRHFLRNEGKEPPIKHIPHQIGGGSDGWCNHANSVHQNVPGCGRICSDINAVGRKDKGTWGSWNAYPGSVDCPAAKLDQVYKMEGNSRKLAVGRYSGRHVEDPMKQFTTGEQLYIKGGKHLRFCADEGHNTICNRGGIGGWERFRFTRNSDGTYSFRGGKHNKWCADEGNKIKCNRNSIGGWEKFRINKNSDGTYSLKGGRHHKWCADEGNTIRCNRNSIGGWERFRIGKV
jgi:hypothetical protein